MISFEQFLPSPPLRRFIRSYQYWEHLGSAEKASHQRVIPDGCVELNFCLGSRVRRRDSSGATQVLSGVYAVGRTSRHYFVQRMGAARFLSVVFRPGGLRRFTPFPGGLLADATAPGVEVFGKTIEALREELVRTPAPSEMSTRVDAFWMRTLDAREDRAPALCEAIQTVALAPNGSSLNSLLGSLSISVRQLEQLFQEHVGTSPGTLARLMRFRRALRIMLARPHAPFHALAASTGYFDQSHLWRDFVQFAGVNPRTWRNEKHPLNDAMMRLHKEADLNEFLSSAV